MVIFAKYLYVVYVDDIFIRIFTNIRIIRMTIPNLELHEKTVATVVEGL